MRFICLTPLSWSYPLC